MQRGVSIITESMRPSSLSIICNARSVEHNYCDEVTLQVSSTVDSIDMWFILWEARHLRHLPWTMEKSPTPYPSVLLQWHCEEQCHQAWHGSSHGLGWGCLTFHRPKGKCLYHLGKQRRKEVIHIGLSIFHC